MRRNRSSGNRAERALGFRWIVAVERFAKLELRDNCPRHFGSKRCSRPRHRLCSGILGLTFATGQERSTSPWPVVTPESQGFDSGVLAELLEHVRTKGLPLHNLLLVRRGQLILDASLYPYSPEGLHDVASVTKSITSVLVGIAIDKGLIESVRQPVVSLLPAAVRGKPDAQTPGDDGREPADDDLWAGLRLRAGRAGTGGNAAQ